MSYTIIERKTLTALRDRILSKDREIAQLSNDITSMRQSIRGESQAHAIEVLKLREQLTASQTMNNAKQQEVAQLRGQVAELHTRYLASIAEAATERHALMDWIAKGVSGGQPIFSELPRPQAEPEPAKPEITGKEVPSSDLTDAMKTAGMRARSIVKHIERKKDAEFSSEFNAAMQGVRKVFSEDKAEAEAEVIAAKEAS